MRNIRQLRNTEYAIRFYVLRFTFYAPFSPHQVDRDQDRAQRAQPGGGDVEVARRGGRRAGQLALAAPADDKLLLAIARVAADHRLPVAVDSAAENVDARADRQRLLAV